MYGVDADPGKGLAMAGLFLVALATFLFKDDDFVGFGLAQEGGGDAGAFHHGRTNAHRAVVILHKQHAVEAQRLDGTHQAVDEQNLVFRDFVLVATDFYDCDHDGREICEIDAKVMAKIVRNQLYFRPMKTFKPHQTDLHRRASAVKNMRRHQHDGGRAWIKDGQLHEAIKGVNPDIRHTR